MRLDILTFDINTMPTKKEMGYTDNPSIIKYIKEHGLYESHFSEMGLMQNQLQQVAKKITVQDKKQALKIMSYVEDLEYIKGYEAYIHTLNENELEIDNSIDTIQQNLNLNGNYDIYISCLVEIAISIVTQYPSKSLILFRKITDTYDTVGYSPSEMLDLAVDIVDNIASSDVHSALKIYEEIVEIECFQVDALQRIVSKTNDEKLKSNINTMILNLKNNSIE